MSKQEYKAVSSAIREAEVIRLFLKKQKERDAMTLLIALGNDKLQAIAEADREKRSRHSSGDTQDRYGDHKGGNR